MCIPSSIWGNQLYVGLKESNHPYSQSISFGGGGRGGGVTENVLPHPHHMIQGKFYKGRLRKAWSLVFQGVTNHKSCMHSVDSCDLAVHEEADRGGEKDLHSLD